MATYVCKTTLPNQSEFCFTVITTNPKESEAKALFLQEISKYHPTLDADALEIHCDFKPQNP